MDGSMELTLPFSWIWFFHVGITGYNVIYKKIFFIWKYIKIIFLKFLIFKISISKTLKNIKKNQFNILIKKLQF